MTRERHLAPVQFLFGRLLTLAIHFERSLDRSSHARLRRCRLNSRLDAGLIATSLRQDGPSDPRQLVGERNCQNIVMQAPSCGGEPRSKTVPRPARRMEQNGTGGPHLNKYSTGGHGKKTANKWGHFPTIDILFVLKPNHRISKSIWTLDNRIVEYEEPSLAYFDAVEAYCDILLNLFWPRAVGGCATADDRFIIEWLNN
jgi:hypothetical protein